MERAEEDYCEQSTIEVLALPITNGDEETLNEDKDSEEASDGTKQAELSDLPTSSILLIVILMILVATIGFLLGSQRGGKKKPPLGLQMPYPEVPNAPELDGPW